LVNWLNTDWVGAIKRLSPQILILLLEAIGDLVTEYHVSLDPWEKAVFSVSWAGESTSYNWMHLAREYTENWHHQQQVREAVKKQGIMTREFFYPVMNTFFQGLPHTFRDIAADKGTVIEAQVTSEPGGRWYLIKTQDGWNLASKAKSPPVAVVRIPVEISWILFSRSIRPDEIEHDASDARRNDYYCEIPPRPPVRGKL